MGNSINSTSNNNNNNSNNSNNNLYQDNFNSNEKYVGLYNVSHFIFIFFFCLNFFFVSLFLRQK
jgi:hypothetical protein